MRRPLNTNWFGNRHRSLNCAELEREEQWFVHEWVVPMDVDPGAHFELEIASVAVCRYSFLEAIRFKRLLIYLLGGNMSGWGYCFISWAQYLCGGNTVGVLLYSWG